MDDYEIVLVDDGSSQPAHAGASRHDRPACEGADAVGVNDGPFLKPPHGIYALEDLHAHVKFPDDFNQHQCEYPPMSDMLVQHMRRRLAADGCASGSPSIAAYGAIALLLKRDEGPAPDFKQFLKRATTTAGGVG